MNASFSGVSGGTDHGAETRGCVDVGVIVGGCVGVWACGCGCGCFFLVFIVFIF